MFIGGNWVVQTMPGIDVSNLKLTIYICWTCARLTVWHNVFKTQGQSTNIDPDPLTAWFGLSSTQNISPTIRCV